MIERVLQLLATTAPELGRWLSLGLALLTVGMLQLWRGARSGNGWLTLCALSRTLPLDEDERARSKRLYRLLRNRSLGGTEMTPFLVRLALGKDPRGIWACGGCVSRSMCRLASGGGCSPLPSPTSSPSCSARARSLDAFPKVVIGATSTARYVRHPQARSSRSQRVRVRKGWRPRA